MFHRRKPDSKKTLNNLSDTELPENLPISQNSARGDQARVGSALQHLQFPFRRSGASSSPMLGSTPQPVLPRLPPEVWVHTLKSGNLTKSDFANFSRVSHGFVGIGRQAFYEDVVVDSFTKAEFWLNELHQSAPKFLPLVRRMTISGDQPYDQPTKITEQQLVDIAYTPLLVEPELCRLQELVVKSFETSEDDLFHDHDLKLITGNVLCENIMTNLSRLTLHSVCSKLCQTLLNLAVSVEKLELNDIRECGDGKLQTISCPPQLENLTVAHVDRVWLEQLLHSPSLKKKLDIKVLSKSSLQADGPTTVNNLCIVKLAGTFSELAGIARVAINLSDISFEAISEPNREEESFQFPEIKLHNLKRLCIKSVWGHRVQLVKRVLSCSSKLEHIQLTLWFGGRAPTDADTLPLEYWPNLQSLIVKYPATLLQLFGGRSISLRQLKTGVTKLDLLDFFISQFPNLEKLQLDSINDHSFLTFPIQNPAFSFLPHHWQRLTNLELSYITDSPLPSAFPEIFRNLTALTHLELIPADHYAPDQILSQWIQDFLPALQAFAQCPQFNEWWPNMISLKYCALAEPNVVKEMEREIALLQGVKIRWVICRVL